MSEETSGTVSNGCSNPSCQYLSFEYDTLKKKVDHELWRAGQAVSRARVLRMCAAVCLYATAFFHIIFAPSIWERVGAVAMIVICYSAMHTEG
jgi:uncharacterized membrane protein YbaN (DUF454 family)